MLNAQAIGTAKDRNPDEVLAIMFRDLLLQENLTPAKFEQLVNEFVLREIPDSEENAEIMRSAARANIEKELCSNTMTPKVFFKALNILGFHAADFEITATGDNDRRAISRQTVVIG